MKNKILYLITMVLFALNSIQAQSKNEQILVLTNKIDTLNGIIIKHEINQNPIGAYYTEFVIK